jgi:hypothetical protein
LGCVLRGGAGSAGIEVRSAGSAVRVKSRRSAESRAAGVGETVGARKAIRSHYICVTVHRCV